MKAKDFKEGKIYFSKITKIAYRKRKGILYKFPIYVGANRKWGEAGYRGDLNVFTELTKDEIEEYGITI